MMLREAAKIAKERPANSVRRMPKMSRLMTRKSRLTMAGRTK